MIELVHDRRLEHLARKYAKKCQWWHSPRESRTSRKFSNHIGENIYYKTGTFYTPDLKKAIKDAVDVFAREAKDYDYHRNYCTPGEKCGHYTQMVWAETEAVGCAGK